MAAKHRGSAGRIAEEKIRPTPPPIKKEIIDRFYRLSDLSSTVSDVLDNLGVVGAIGTSALLPTLPEKKMVGRAITVRNVPQTPSVQRVIQTRANFMTEVEGMHQADPGDVLVIQGLPDISNMGGIMAATAFHSGLIGAIVDGAIRDAASSRALGFPIWSRGLSPITGKWRIVTEEINGTVRIGDVSVTAGDLVVADETGVCFVPAMMVEDVLAACEAIHAKEENWILDLQNGLSIPDLVKRIY